MPVTINGTTGINSPGGTFTGAVTTNGLSNSMTTFNQLTTTVSNNNQVGVKITRTGGTNLVNWEIYNGSGDASKSLRFYETVDRMILDASGRLTLPFQPAFTATRVGGAVPINTVVVWDAVILNRGSHYSTSTGRFTAPIAGVYAFWWRGDNATNQGLQMGIRVNGSDTLNGVGFGGFGWTGGNVSGHASAFVIIQLSANDYVDVRNESYGPLQGDPGYNNGFGGYLIG